MAQDSKTSEKQTAAGKPVVEDLSEAIEQTVDKQPDEEVRSVRVFGNCYRCNWWVHSRSTTTMLALNSGKIRKSRFLRATRSADKLVIEELSGRK